MMSMSLFDGMEDYPLQEDYLDQTFGLSAEILAADLGTDGSILEFGNWPGGGLKHDAVQDVAAIDDLLLLNSDDDPLGDEWMETLDMSVFLDNAAISSSTLLSPPAPIAPAPTAVVAKPTKQNVRQVAFDILKKLLTGEISDPTLPVLPEPVATEDTFADNLLESLEAASNTKPTIQIQPELILGNGDIVEIEPRIKLEPSTDATPEEHMVTEAEVASGLIDITDPLLYLCTSSLQSQLSEEQDVESILSSGPSSPSEQSITFHTIDDALVASISESATSPGVLSQSDWSDSVHSHKKKYTSRSSPYSSDSEDMSCLSKKERKKRQNKNAATRYRQKKRTEKETVTDQELRLFTRNKELHEKVDSLQREIAYMKELMSEIYKVKNENI